MAAGLGGLVVAALTGVPAKAQSEAELEEAARKEGTLTWYVAPFDSQTAERMGQAFIEQYPGVRVAVIRTTGQVAYQRLQQELKNNAPQCDVFSSTDIAQYQALTERKALAHFVPQNASSLLPEFGGLAEDGYWYPTATSVNLMIYNTQKVTQAEAPKTWLDLLDPKWKGQVAIAHPAFSGCTGVWALALRNAYGWQYFEKLAKNNPRVGRSGNDPVTLVNAGECLVGPAPDGSTFLNVERGNPIGVVYPSDGVTLCVNPSAVMANAPHPNAARLFMNWLMSDRFSRMAAAMHSTPVRAGPVLTAGQKALNEVKVMRLSIAEIRKGVPEVVEQWRDTFGG